MVTSHIRECGADPHQNRDWYKCIQAQHKAICDDERQKGAQQRRKQPGPCCRCFLVMLSEYARNDTGGDCYSNEQREHSRPMRKYA